MSDKILTVHHLHTSQSERILFLLEEMGTPYKLVLHQRMPGGLAPDSLKKLHPAGTAPVVEDWDAQGQRLVLGESGAIVEYILGVYGAGTTPLQVRPGAPNYAAYVDWLHWTNASFQSSIMRLSAIGWTYQGLGHDPAAPPKDEAPLLKYIRNKPALGLRNLDDRLAKVPYLAGDTLTAADCMLVFSLTTMRGFQPLDLSPFPHVLAYLKRIGDRPAYRRAMEKGDPTQPLRLGPTADRIKL